ncbi:hypothetical protein NECAME_10479 [Necator americanus]|uniref:Uncharacterized protein n=1 Tax=Necator americanus TaxID=51031 RepID=W2TBC0_NECAM|nr:hypothetical protein NECAME_10479 [Necator americanus]ETN78282.1 hypothetical protein NECAME_10479 [Necator americanus]
MICIWWSIHGLEYWEVLAEGCTMIADIIYLYPFLDCALRVSGFGFAWGTVEECRNEELERSNKNAHGFDFIQPEMTSIMFARGPSFKENFVLPPFQNVEYMNLWTKLLQLPAHENDGDPDFMNLALIAGGGALRVQHSRLTKCGMTKDIASKSLETICGKCTIEDKEAFARWAGCPIGGASAIVNITTDARDFCYMVGCNDLAVIGASKGDVYLGTLIEVYDAKSDEQLVSNECTFHLWNRTNQCKRAPVNEEVEYRTMSAFDGRVLANDYSLIVPWRSKFVKGILDPLNKYTRKIVEKLGRVLSITGTAYDEDYDGKYSMSPHNSPYPTHLYRILIACDGDWSTNGLNCSRPEQTKSLSFVFPHMNGDPNCLAENELLLLYTATIRDVEALSGLYFNFTNIPNKQQMLLKMHTNTRLW